MKPFQHQTGCKVHSKFAGSSDEMVTLMRQGGGSQYDMVSASGDASLRLIRGHIVKPVNVDLVPGWKDFIPQLKSPSHNTVDGKHYGISLQWGPNTLLFNTQKVKPAPTSWSAIYAPTYKGQITVPDNAIQIADAALYLSKTQPDLGIKDPYELTKAQLDAAAKLLKQQKPLIKKYWALASDEIDLFHRRVVAVPDEHPGGRRGSGQRPDTEGRCDGVGGHVDALGQGQASQLRVSLAEVHLDAEGASDAGALVRRDASEPEGLSVHEQDPEGRLRAVPRQRAGVLLQQHQVLENAHRRLRQRQERLHGLHGLAAEMDPNQGVAR